MLVEHTLFGIRDKVQIAIDRIRQFEPLEGYYVAFSGGKDSCVILDLVKRAGVKYDAHYNLTTVDPPELVQFIKKYHSDVQWNRPKETMWKLIARKGMFPLRQARWCCAELKEGGGKGRVVVTGVRWQESVRRSKRRMVETCITDNSKRFLHPIIDWSEYEIWQYIRQNNIPYCKLYDEGFHRLGCILCPMVKNHQELGKQIRKWPKVYEAYKKAAQKGYKKMVEHRLKNGLDPRFLTWQDWFEWWIWERNNSAKQNPDQTVIFE